MFKKIISLFLIVVMVVSLTGCGNKKQEYTENMKEMRGYTAGYLDNKSLGELLDIAIVNANWQETPKQGATKSGNIIVKGKDKNTKEDVELVWKTTLDMYESNGFISFTKDKEKLTYGEFLDYLKSYIKDEKE